MSRLWPIGVAAVLGLSVVPSCAAQQNEAALQTELPTPESSESSEPHAATEADVVEEIDVSVALGSDGMLAVIHAPKTASVRAMKDELEVVSGPDYHLLVGRGAVEPLGEKARIVRRFGANFRRFLLDEGSLVVYETGTPQEQRYHFFMTASADGALEYHCRTPSDGMPTQNAVEHMIDVCKGVRLQEGEPTTDDLAQ